MQRPPEPAPPPGDEPLLPSRDEPISGPGDEPVPAPLDGPGVGVTDTRELLLGYLEWYRDALARKLCGLSDGQLRAPLDAVGWSPLGLVQHLTWVERRWMRWGFAAEDVVAHPPGGDASEWSVAPDRPTAEVVAAYRAEVAAARSLTAGADLADRARLGGRFRTPAEAPSLGRILFHLLQEYARHLGHLDIARQLIDGSTGE